MKIRLKQTLKKATFLMIVLFNIGCDQISKTIVRDHLDYDDRIELIENYFTLLRIENAGAFLSLGDSLPTPFKFILLSLLPFLTLTFGMYLILTRMDLKTPIMIGICFIVGGGIGNLYDRIVYGSVTDFLHLNFVLFQTGIFNMADVSIMIGMCIVLAVTYNSTTEIVAISNP